MRMACIPAAAVLAVAAAASPVGGESAADTATGTIRRAPDHVLVWSQTPDAGIDGFAKMGFVVSPGQTYPEGMTGSTVVFQDWSYLELLHFSDASRAAGNAQAEGELEFVAAAPGANSLAIEVGNVDAAAAFLTAQGLDVAPVSVDTVDPDGPEGPEPPREASWRDFHFVTSPVAGLELFFIQYPPEPAGSESGEGPQPARLAHGNTARHLSAVWVAVPDIDAEAEIYRRMGFAIGRADAGDMGPARTAKLGGTGLVLVDAAKLGEGYALAGRPGPRIVGLSFAVADLGTARGVVERAGLAVSEVSGPFGPAFRVNATPVLGLFVDFHAAPPP